MGRGAATLGAMSNSPNARRLGGPRSWAELSRPDAEQSQRFLAEALALLLADLLRSVLSDASPALPADEAAVERYRNLADSLGGRRDPAAHESRHHPCRPRQALRHLAQAAAHSRARTPKAARRMREFVDALGLFPALFDSEPSARSRRARLTWLLTHDRRLDASTREAATALIEACEHLGVLLWPDAENCLTQFPMMCALNAAYNARFALTRRRSLNAHIACTRSAD